MSNAVRLGIYQKLSGTSSVTSKLATTGSIYHGQAPNDAAYPLIIFSKIAGTKTRAFQTPNAFNRETWMVKAIDRGTSSTRAEGIIEAVDAALDNGTITVSGKRLADLTHVSDVDYLEPDGDQLYRHHGASYAVITTAT